MESRRPGFDLERLGDVFVIPKPTASSSVAGICASDTVSELTMLALGFLTGVTGILIIRDRAALLPVKLPF